MSLRPAEEAFIVTIGIRHRHKDLDCRTALLALQRAGFRAAATSGDAILALADQERAVRELKNNDPEGE